MKFKCSTCNYISDKKYNIEKHIKNKCKDGVVNIVNSIFPNKCEFCKKEFTTKPILTRHLKTCKFKKTDSDIGKELEIILEKVKELEKENETLKEIISENENNEKIIENIIKTTTKKILGNTPVETIRSQARKKYKDLFKNMKCVHCKHEGSTQVCHIKAISEFDRLSDVEEINKMSNLIGLCPNCHIDLDRHKKFEVTRTSVLHNMLLGKIKNRDSEENIYDDRKHMVKIKN